MTTDTLTSYSDGYQTMRAPWQQRMGYTLAEISMDRITDTQQESPSVQHLLPLINEQWFLPTLEDMTATSMSEPWKIPTSDCHNFSQDEGTKMHQWSPSVDFAAHCATSQHHTQAKYTKTNIDMPASTMPQAKEADENRPIRYAKDIMKFHSNCESRSLWRDRQSARKQDASPPSKKTLNHKKAHALVEKRYRKGIEARLQSLQDALVLTVYTQATGLGAQCTGNGAKSPVNMENGQGMGETQRKHRKCDILDAAISYIHGAEVDMRHMHQELKSLKDKIQELERIQATTPTWLVPGNHECSSRR